MNNGIFKRTACLIAGICAAAAVQAAEAKDVVIALEGSYAPWNYTKPGGTLGGFEPELARVLCERAHITCKLIAVDWDSMIPSLNADKFDVIMDAMSITDERKKAIDFSIPYAVTKSSFFTATGNREIFKNMGSAPLHFDSDVQSKTSVNKIRSAFKGKVIGVQAATNYVPFVRSNFSDVAEIREYKSPKDRDLDLKSGRIDVSIENTVYLHNLAGSDFSLVGPVISGKVWGDGVGLGFRKTDTALRMSFDKAIASVKADGTLSRLSEKFLKTDVAPQ